MKKPILFAILFVMVLASVAAILQSGWTGTTVPSVARTALGVPGLTNNNVFTGSNFISGQFTGNLNGATNYNSSNLVGTVWGGISNPATGGTNVLITNAKTTIQNGSANTVVVTNGSVGIETATPESKLSIDGGVGTVIGISLGSVNNSITASRYIGIIGGTNMAADSGFQGIEFGGKSSVGEGYLAFHTHDVGTSSGERVRIDKSGNLGVGGFSGIATSALAEFAGYDYMAKFGLRIAPGNAYSAAANGSLFFATKYNSAGAYADMAGIAGGKETAVDAARTGYLVLYTTPASGTLTERVRINSDGNFGIGTTTPTSGRLVVDGGGITFGTDNTYGIGAVGANRPAFIQVGTTASAFAGGLGSSRSNRLAAATITVTASPFNWTNTANVNAVVYIDGISVTGTVGVNGSTVFNSIGQNTVMLQTNEWTTITYTLGTPTATWKPF